MRHWRDEEQYSVNKTCFGVDWYCFLNDSIRQAQYESRHPSGSLCFQRGKESPFKSLYCQKL